MRKVSLLAAAVTLSFAAPAWAAVEITLTPRDAEGNEVTGPVEAGTTLTVDLVLAVEAGDADVSDVREVRFDLTASSSNLAIGEFTWTLDLESGDDLYLELNTPPIYNVIYLGLEPTEGTILAITETPQVVATVEVTVEGDGTLEVLNLNAASGDQGAQISAGFDDPVELTAAGGDLIGGTLELTVVAEEPVGNDNANDNVADNANDNEVSQGPRVTGGICGLGAVSGFAACGVVLCAMRALRPRRR